MKVDGVFSWVDDRLQLKQNDRHLQTFANAVLWWIAVVFWFKILLKLAPNDPTDNKSALVLGK